jgi:hypothetical protein
MIESKIIDISSQFKKTAYRIENMIRKKKNLLFARNAMLNNIKEEITITILDSDISAKVRFNKSAKITIRVI